MRLNVEVINLMSRLFLLLGVIITISFVTGCSTPQAIDEISESSPSQAITETAIEYTQAPFPIENGPLNEPLVKETPGQLKGFAEDESLSVSLLAQIESDHNDYKTNIEFHNKSDKSLDLVFDCGLLISNDQFALKQGDCPAVESMLLKKNMKETQALVLSKNFFEIANNVITVRYRQDQKTKDLEVKLEVPE